jgi:hypothetical protein
MRGTGWASGGRAKKTKIESDLREEKTKKYSNQERRELLNSGGLWEVVDALLSPAVTAVWST